MDSFKGVIIEESLEDRSILKDPNLVIVGTEVEQMASQDQLEAKQWTMDTVVVSPEKVHVIAYKISKSLDQSGHWYADFKNKLFHYVIFRDTIFCIERKNKEEYEKARHHGRLLGIPEGQLDFG